MVVRIVPQAFVSDGLALGGMILVPRFTVGRSTGEGCRMIRAWTCPPATFRSSHPRWASRVLSIDRTRWTATHYPQVSRVLAAAVVWCWRIVGLPADPDSLPPPRHEPAAAHLDRLSFHFLS